MPKINPLFSLIHSLSQTEKAYFKKQAQAFGAEGKGSLMLFDIVEKQVEYDELKVKAQLKGNAFANNLTKNKNYLYDQIAKSLFDYHLKWSVPTQLMQKLRIIEIFIEKQLYAQAFKILRSAKKKAEEYELFIELYLLLGHEMRIPKRYRMKYYLSSNEILVEQKKALRYSNNIKDFESLHARFVEEYEKLLGESVVVMKKKYDKLLAEPLLLDKSKCLTTKSLISYYLIIGNCHFRLRNFKDAHQHILKTVEIYQAKKYLIYLDPMEYLNSVYNLCISLAELKLFSKMFETLNTFKVYAEEPVMKKSKNLLRRIFEIQHYVPLVILNRLGENKRAEDIIKSLLTNIENYELPESKKVRLFFEVAYYGFIQKNYKLSLRFIQFILNNTTGEGKVFVCYTKLLSLIIHFELGNESVIKRQLTTFAEDILMYNKKVHQPILDFFLSDSRQIFTARELVNQFVKLKLIIEELIKADNAIESMMVEYFDILSWINSKVEKKSFLAVVQQKVINEYGKHPFER